MNGDGGDLTIVLLGKEGGEGEAEAAAEAKFDGGASGPPPKKGKQDKAAKADKAGKKVAAALSVAPKVSLT